LAHCLRHFFLRQADQGQLSTRQTVRLKVKTHSPARCRLSALNTSLRFSCELLELQSR
jgi:hypothetical protein